MKLAKRALVVVMVVAMIGCMSAMAFASGSVSLVKVDEKNVAVQAVNAIGLKSFDFVITADAGIVLKNVKASSDGNDCTAADNAFTTEKNMAEGKFSGYFKENLWERDAWVAAADDLGEEISASFDPANFNMGTIVYDASAAAGPAYIYVKGTVKSESGDFTVDTKVCVVEGEVPTEPAKTEAPKTDAPKTDAPKTDAPKTDAPKTDAPKTDAPKTDAPKTDAPKTDAPKTDAPKTDAPKTDAPKTDAPKTDASKTDAAKTDAAKTTKAPAATQKNPNTGDVPTGDNMALAAAFGVVALAGAAFVISKKRK